MKEAHAVKLAISLMILAAGVFFVQTSAQSPRDLPLLAQFDFEKGNADGWQPNDPGH
jgi:hypothetical protein